MCHGDQMKQHNITSGLFLSLEEEAHKLLTINEIGNYAAVKLMPTIGGVKIDAPAVVSDDFFIIRTKKTCELYNGKTMILNGIDKNAVIFVGYAEHIKHVSLWNKIKSWFIENQQNTSKEG
jgi:hypothetical protein